MALPLNRLTPRARKILVMAGDAAEERGQRFIGTEHLLWALAEEGQGVAAQILDALKVRQSVEGEARQVLDASAPNGDGASNAADHAVVFIGPGGPGSNYPIQVASGAP